MPPKCTFCGSEQADFHDLVFDIIYFKPTVEDEAWNQRVIDEGIDGHPPNAFWFCSKHIAIAKKYETLYSKDALSTIKPKEY